MLVLDFETQAIGLRPNAFPPKSVGVALRLADRPQGAYLAHGHPSGNTHSWEEVRRAMADHWDQPVVTHNGGAFDLQIACEEFGLPWPQHWHDTLFLLFLNDPRQPNLSLKPSAELLLGLPPTTRDAVRDWIMANVKPRPKPTQWGAHIAKAPGDLVGPYAVDDTAMTLALFNLLHLRIWQAGMQDAYKRELALAPILWRSSQHGVRVDRERLAVDYVEFCRTLKRCDDEIRQTLNAPNLNIDSGDELAAALEAAGLIDQWVLTATGKRSTARPALDKGLNGHPIAGLLAYRGALDTLVNTFMGPWLELSEPDGRLHPRWNQVRSPDDRGARTGRLSCQDPNLMNAAKGVERKPPEGWPALPQVRSYLLPEEGHQWVRVDAVQQEYRVLAHYEDGEMMRQYQAQPDIDFHNLARDMIGAATGQGITRKTAKTIGFTILYGGGLTLLSERLGCSEEDARALRNAYYEALPGIKTVQEDIRQQVRLGKPIRTWGGRLYRCEEPRMVDVPGQPGAQKWQTYEYKLLNYLIQGSSADLTKTAVINYDRTREHGIFLTQVHDEINVSVPVEHAKSEAALVQAAFADVQLDVPMLSEASFGENYGAVE